MMVAEFFIFPGLALIILAFQRTEILEMQCMEALYLMCEFTVALERYYDFS